MITPLFLALSGADKEAILIRHGITDSASNSIASIAHGDYRNKTENEIRGTGYVVHSLEAALWCFWHTDTFQQAILQAVNLGDDADTTAAICGQVAGAYYGASGIPNKWTECLVMKNEISA